MGNIRGDKLQSVIRYLLAKCPRRALNTTQLVKLLFLIDYEYYQTFGTTITNVPYVSYNYGPYAEGIVAESKRMKDVSVRYCFYPSFTGRAYSLRENSPSVVNLDATETGVVDSILEHYGEATAKELARITHDDEFLQQFEHGSVIDFTLLDADPLDDERLQDAIMADEELYQSVRKAERQLSTRS